MQLIALVALLTIAVAAPAEAAWQQYVNRELGFAVAMPDEPAVTTGEYRTTILGQVPSTIFTTMNRGIAFTVTVVDVSGRLMDSASILQELIYIRTRDLDVVSDSLSRSEPGPTAAYGRRVTEDRPDGSRVAAAFYLTKGSLFLFEASVPPGGDKESPFLGRFVDSVAFNLDRDWNVVPGGGPPAGQ